MKNAGTRCAVEDISLGFKIEGHALSREEIESTTGDAYDMICNSVSVLSQSAVIGMQEVLKLPVKYEINDGFLSLNLHNLNREISSPMSMRNFMSATLRGNRQDLTIFG